MDDLGRKYFLRLSTDQSVVFFAVASFILSCLLLLFQPMAFSDLWAVTLENYGLNLLLNWFPLFVFMVLFYFIGLGAIPSFSLVSALAIGMYMVNYYFIILGNYPFMSFDLLFSGGLVDILEALDGRFILYVLLYVLATIALCVFVRSERLHFSLRVIALFFCAITLFFGNLALYYSGNIHENLAVSGSEYNVVDNFNSRGFLYSFIFTNNQLAHFRSAATPPDYNPEAAREAISRGDTSGIEPLREVDKPHIVMIRTEAFSEIGFSPHFNFAGHTDPLENWNRIRRDAISGEIVVPNFGGSTGDTEFDVLTGINSDYFVAPYSFRLIDSNFDSMATALNSIGYRSEFFYPGDAWRYNRLNAYRHLGFDETLFAHDFSELSSRESTATEMEAVEYLIESFEESLAEHPGVPHFHFGAAVSDRKFYSGEHADIDTEDQNFETHLNLAEGTISALTHHFNNLREADLALEYVHNYFSESSEPVVLVYFTDQLPPLPMQIHNLIFPNLHYPGSLEDVTRLNRAPFMIWLNDAAKELYGIEYAYELIDDDERLYFSSSYLGGFLLEILGYRNVSPFFDFTMDLRRRFPVVTEEVSFDAYRNPSTYFTREELEPLALYRDWSIYRIFDE